HPRTCSKSLTFPSSRRYFCYSRIPLLCRSARYRYSLCRFFFLNDPATTEIYTLSLHDALPIYMRTLPWPPWSPIEGGHLWHRSRSEEHTSELQSRFDLVCRLLLEKKKNYVVVMPIASRLPEPKINESGMPNAPTIACIM